MPEPGLGNGQVEEYLRLICCGTEGRIECFIRFLPLKARETSDSPVVALLDGLEVEFSRELQWLRFSEQQEVGWQQPTWDDSFFSQSRYNTKS
ncbi:MAG: hypothetical protein JO235_06420 [Chroococcidiopsidaceae cyanobacterium CP_BM_RX_35]|nr:hypothetical protein [Chroococcidiopsidaceae cyanobacterium CP_BM_RX_35]